MIEEGLIDGDGSEFVDDSTEGIEIEPVDEESDVAKLAEMHDDYLDDESNSNEGNFDSVDLY
jgi:hypothetical protein